MYSQITGNKRASIVFMFAITCLILAVSFVVSYINGGQGYELMPFALGFGLVSNLLAYYGGDKVALGVSKAREIKKEDNPYVWRMVENLCIASGLQMPRVYIIEDDAMNAFATGRSPRYASIALTTGIINGLENEELEGVIAHELSHIQNYDIRFMTLVASLLGTLMIIVDWGLRIGCGRDSDSNSNGLLALIGILFVLLAPLIGELIKLAISRRREYLADASGSLMTRYPEGLANALQKIKEQDKPLQHASNAIAHLFFASPFGQSKKIMQRLFSTHPPIDDRIVKLRAMAGSTE